MVTEKRAAVYHFTDKSENRPAVYQKELDRLRQFAVSKGCPDVDVFVDKTLVKGRQKQREELLGKAGSYRALVLKDFYHLARHTDRCMAYMNRLNRQGIEVWTVEDGSFCFAPPPLELPLKAAVYYCGLEIVGHSSQLQYDCMDLFVRMKTRWNITGHYADMEGNRKNGNQKELQKLIAERDRYDVVLVQSFGHIHWRTSAFCKIRHRLQKGIYSMYNESYLPYEKGGCEWKTA